MFMSSVLNNGCACGNTILLWNNHFVQLIACPADYKRLPRHIYRRYRLLNVECFIERFDSFSMLTDLRSMGG